MELQGIDFGPVWDAAGVEGFYGEGYRFHKPWKRFGLQFDGCTFVAKTTTLLENPGYMPLETDGITPKELKPKCIKVYFKQGFTLNAVGLSGPGFNKLIFPYPPVLEKYQVPSWQDRVNPFFLSFMAKGGGQENVQRRIEELESFVIKLKSSLSQFQTQIGLQINYSCPNIGIDPGVLIKEIEIGLKIASALGIPLVPKLNILVPPRAAKAIADNKYCDALCISNTIPWGKFPEKINWKGLFGTTESPLAQFGGGGLSGKPLLPLVCDWLHDAVFKEGIKKPINAGGGILSPEDVSTLRGCGASSVFIGSMAILRPWRVKETIERAYLEFR